MVRKSQIVSEKNQFWSEKKLPIWSEKILDTEEKIHFGPKKYIKMVRKIFIMSRENLISISEKI